MILNDKKAKKIEPHFDDSLLQPETLLNHIQELQKESEAKKVSNTNAFPIEVFPEPIKAIILGTNECLNYPIDFIGASLLYAISVAIGNTHKVEIKSGWQESAVLYISIVGRPGINKSHPVSFALKPIENRDSFKYQKYQKDKLEYDAFSNLTKKEREDQGSVEPIIPIWEQHLVSDFTPEALTDVHKFNKRGIGVYVDELASWFKNFNRYNKGSEEQFWLSVWSGKPIRTNRKTTESTYIRRPFISVIGTIQPAVLNELADNRTDNGFLDRILFVTPSNLQKPYWSEKELNPEIESNWETYLSNLLDMPMSKDETNDIQPIILKFTPEAKQLLFQWQRELTDQTNNEENEAKIGVYSKMDMYVVRLALCLEMARFACNKSDKKAVGIEAIEGAIKLVAYFTNSAFKVHSIVSNINPLDNIPNDKKDLYNSLPKKFITSEGVIIAKNKGIPERTFKNFLNNKDLFNRTKRGEYEKLI